MRFDSGGADCALCCQAAGAEEKVKERERERRGKGEGGARDVKGKMRGCERGERREWRTLEAFVGGRDCKGRKERKKSRMEVSCRGRMDEWEARSLARRESEGHTGHIHPERGR
jgi:hypothetical protein